ncbi:MAG: hypothetical protein ACK5IJ_05405 [Mangrovibacterium sp.]
MLTNNNLGFKKKSEQKIMVYCDFSDSDYQAIAHGIRMSEIFQLELCLFHAVDEKAIDAKANAQLRLAQVIKRIQPNAPQISISSLCLKGSFPNCIRRMVDGFDAILIVCSNSKLKLKIKTLQQSRVPFLFVGESSENHFSYKQVIVPLDYRKVMKSSSLWGAYFARFNHAELEILTAHEKFNSNKQKLDQNIKSIERMLTGLGLKASYTPASKSSFQLPSEALTRAKVKKSDLIIIPASQKVTPLDWLIGLPESKIIKKANGLPVMCINPSHDMLTLCE